MLVLNVKHYLAISRDNAPQSMGISARLVYCCIEFELIWMNGIRIGLRVKFSLEKLYSDFGLEFR